MWSEGRMVVDGGMDTLGSAVGSGGFVLELRGWRWIKLDLSKS